VIYSKIEVPEDGNSRQHHIPKVPSATARWYYDDDDLILNQDLDYPRAVLLLVTTRLGLSGIDPSYHDGLRALFDLPQCVGLLGGKPNFALYFVGHTQSPDNSHMIFLDPHFVQDSIVTPNGHYICRPPNFDTYFPSVRSTAKKINMNQLDPGVGIGLLIRNGGDLRKIKEAFAPGKGRCSSVATIHEKKPDIKLI